MIYIIGINSFISKHLYINIKKEINNIILLSYLEINLLKNVKNEDIIINCCGVNRGNSYSDFEQGNYLFIEKLFDIIKNSKPYFIHISSYMVNGFKNTNFSDLPDYQKWFIESKLKGEEFLLKNYDNTKFCIIRPTNIYGYDCKPYYNNLLSTLIYEKINNIRDIKNINKNCIRNWISIESVVKIIKEILNKKEYGIFNILSNNTLNLNDLLNIIYNNNIPENFKILNGDNSIPKDNSEIENKYIQENLLEEIKILEKNMKTYYELKNQVKIQTCSKLIQDRGDMVEISSLSSNRLYKITLNKNSVRGNHFHYEQIEDFYINKGKVLFLTAFNHEPNIIFMILIKENDIIKINPYIIHTLSNDFIDNIPDIIIGSTQKFIPNEIPDTKYINIL